MFYQKYIIHKSKVYAIEIDEPDTAEQSVELHKTLISRERGIEYLHELGINSDT